MAAARSRGGVDDTRVKPRSDAYVGLLVLSLLALTAAMLFAYLNWSAISKQPPQVQTAPVGGAGRTITPPPPSGPATPPGAPGMNAPPVPGQGQAPQGNQPPPPPGNQPPQKK